MNYKINVLDHEYEVAPEIHLYTVSDFMGKEMHGIAVCLTWKNPETGIPEPFSTITKSFGEFIGLKNCAYIDLNNCPFATQLLQEGIAADTGFTKQSGMCTYPLWQFKEEFLKEHGEANYKLYSDEYDQYMSLVNCDADEDEDIEEDQSEEMSMQL